MSIALRRIQKRMARVEKAHDNHQCSFCKKCIPAGTSYYSCYLGGAAAFKGETKEHVIKAVIADELQLPDDANFTDYYVVNDSIVAVYLLAGQWYLRIDPQQSGNTFRLTIDGANYTLEQITYHPFEIEEGEHTIIIENGDGRARITFTIE